MITRRPYERINPKTSPTKSPPPGGIEWAAGFWEANGCIIGPKGTQITAGLRQRESLDRLRSWFGGGVYTQRVEGKIVGYVWAVSSYQAIDFINLIWHFISKWRRDQLAAKLETCAKHLKAHLSEEIRDYILHLQQFG